MMYDEMVPVALLAATSAFFKRVAGDVVEHPVESRVRASAHPTVSYPLSPLL